MKTCALVLLALVASSAITGAVSKPIPSMKAFRGFKTSPYQNDQFNFLTARFFDGIPHSYDAPDSYWRSAAYLPVDKHEGSLHSQVAIQDRTCTKYGLNIYDGATWEIALALEGEFQLADAYENEVLFTSSTGKDQTVGGVKNIRAVSSDFKYGANQIPGSALSSVLLPANATNPDIDSSTTMPGGFFFRMISSSYQLQDPFLGRYARSFIYNPEADPAASGPSWNTHGAIIWNDWKPITGENVWAAIIGPIQHLMLKSKGAIPMFNSVKTAPDAIKLALSVLPALAALQTPHGALYHAPQGAKLWPEDEKEGQSVSNENNFSAFGALKMLQFVLRNNTIGGVDGELQNYKDTVDRLVDGLLGWFKIGGLSDVLPSGNRVMYQGGHIGFDGTIDLAPIDDSENGGFAVDCQTWGAAALGVDVIDNTLGTPGTAYRMWQETKARAGYFSDEAKTMLGGVGFTNHGDHDIWSAEWTFGAILMTRTLADQYAKLGNMAYANDLRADAASMSKAVSQLTSKGGMRTPEGGYLYSNKEFFIPWGWYAHAVPSTCATAWAIMNEHEFNPFVLGGGLYSM
eukprot:GILJ01001480.1.p1 GENE.GILJ01001480.1~~GILJ01001480.1.p1  ORF type:complete len:597 (+),score=118.51 GILJ01001480.1:75-1793(+)